MYVGCRLMRAVVCWLLCVVLLAVLYKRIAVVWASLCDVRCSLWVSCCLLLTLCCVLSIDNALFAAVGCLLFVDC